MSAPIAINGVFMTAILDTRTRVTVVSDAFVQHHWAGLTFTGVYVLNGIKSVAPITVSQSEVVEFTVGDSIIIGNVWNLLLLIIVLWGWTLLPL